MSSSRILSATSRSWRLASLPRATNQPICRMQLARYSDEAAAPPPLMQKLKTDLKTAMRAKDTQRLSVLRSVMSANLNASKTANPIKTDVQVVALMRRLAKSAEDAAAEARANKREDLAEKEDAQIAILNEYVAGSGVEALDETALRALVQEAVQAAKDAGGAGKSIMGDVMKRLAPKLEGKDVDRKAVANLVKEVAGQ